MLANGEVFYNVLSMMLNKKPGALFKDLIHPDRTACKEFG